MAWFDRSEMKNRVRALVALVLVPLLLASSRQAPRAIAFSLAYGTGRTLDVFLQRDTPFGGFLVQTGQLTLELRPLDSTQRSYSLAANAPGRISAAGVPCPGAVSIGMACFPERNVVKVPFLLPDSLKSGMYTAKLIARGSAAHETDGSPLPVGRAIYPSLIYVPSVTNDVALIQARQRYLRKTVYAVAGPLFSLTRFVVSTTREVTDDLTIIRARRSSRSTGVMEPPSKDSFKILIAISLRSIR
jgi:hypothetical protein